MRKQPEVEDGIKKEIRDQLALTPLVSVQKVRIKLYLNGYRSVSNGTLDWQYVAKLIKKIRTENLIKLTPENRTERLVMFKERHRILTEELTDIVRGKPLMTLSGVIVPTQRDRIAAVNTILKWDKALLFTEAQINLLDKTRTIKRKRTRSVIVTDTISETNEIGQIQNPEILNTETKPSAVNSIQHQAIIPSKV